MSENIKKALPYEEGDKIIASSPKPKFMTPKWTGRPILHEDHADQLERDAAINEFGLGQHRSVAEDNAYKKYMKGQSVQAAAHHLQAMKAAHAVGDMKTARKHALMYNQHSKILGHDPVRPPHPEVQSHMEQNPLKSKFRAHKADALLLVPSEEQDRVITSAKKPKL